ncbi:MAG: glycerophosphodiester phosphodiesterase [Anaerolineaceae bacterium]
MESTRKVLNIAHRGARSLAPENTIAAAKKALELGADMWEMDVAMTADGEMVVIHDDTLTRTSNAAVLFGNRKPLKVHNFTLKELRLLDFGSWFNNTDPFKQIRAGNVTLEEMNSFVGLTIPTLEEALVFTRDNQWRINVEIKDLKGTPGDEVVVGKVVKMISDLGMTDQVIISSFQHHYISQVKEINPEIQTGALIEWLDLEPLKTLARTGANAYHPGTRLINAKTIRQIREKGYDINVWTVNKEPSMRKLIKAGATGIITDFPQVFTKVIQLFDRS